MIPVGVQEVKRGFPEKRSPRFSGWYPSTSFPGLTASITRSASTCFGSGSWTRIPSISGSAFSRSDLLEHFLCCRICGKFDPDRTNPHPLARPVLHPHVHLRCRIAAHDDRGKVGIEAGFLDLLF